MDSVNFWFCSGKFFSFRCGLGAIRWEARHRGGDLTSVPCKQALGHFLSVFGGDFCSVIPQVPRGPQPTDFRFGIVVHRVGV